VWGHISKNPPFPKHSQSVTSLHTSVKWAFAQLCHVTWSIIFLSCDCCQSLKECQKKKEINTSRFATIRSSRNFILAKRFAVKVSGEIWRIQAQDVKLQVIRAVGLFGCYIAFVAVMFIIQRQLSMVHYLCTNLLFNCLCAWRFQLSESLRRDCTES